MDPQADNSVIQAKCEEFLQSLGVPGFIVFGWKKSETEYGVVSSHRQMPVNAAVKGMCWALNDFINRSL